MNNLANAPANALAAKEARDKAYRKKGIAIAIFSGFLYGGYTSFMTLGMGSGVWVDYYAASGVAAGVSAFFLVYTLSALGAAVNDLCSAVWSLIYGGIIGRLKDFGRTLQTKPGRTLVIAALIGGPFASTCYVIGLQMAGSIIVPIAALNAAIGAIIGRFLYKQKLSLGMIAGIVICFAAAVLIGSTSMTDGLNFDGQTVLGMAAAFLAALGWGIEGAVGGYACCIADYEVAIIIRQVTSGVANGLILVTILSIMGGDGATGLKLLGTALVDTKSIWMFFIAGMFASFSFKFWYKGASMCGAALGMGCNGMYAFWGPLYCYVLLGLIYKWDGYAIPWQGWVGALVMVVGIVTLAISQDKATQEA